MKRLVRLAIGFLLLASSNVTAHVLPVLQDLPVRWQSIERWHWQGQQLTSQQFSSDQDVIVIAQQIQQRIDTDLRIQRLSTAWLLSFEQEKTHYLIFLSTAKKGIKGWLSSLDLTNPPLSVSISAPPLVFLGLYQHSWSVKSVDLTAPTYFVLQPIEKEKRQNHQLWSKFTHRLKREGWSGNVCEGMTSWCQWQHGSQKLEVWVDPNDGLWHALWWPKSLRGNQ